MNCHKGVFQSFVTLLVSLITTISFALDFESGKVVTVHETDAQSVFVHLESGGRPAIAENDGKIAIVWEDNSSGTPAVYLASRTSSTDAFGSARRVSSGAAAYAPIIHATGDAFLITWEQDDAIFASKLSMDGGMSTPEVLIEAPARQIGMSYRDGELLAAWVQGGYRDSTIATTVIDTDELTVTDVFLVDEGAPATVRAYASVTHTGEGHLVSWQDRRTGTNVIRYARSSGDGEYTPSAFMSETIIKSEIFGKGSGVMRGVVSSMGDDGVLGLWLDKRSSQSGYSAYATVSLDNGASFDQNEKVHDSFGDSIPQWNATIVSDDEGKVFAMWNDSREETQDVHYSHLVDFTSLDLVVWSDDVTIGAASGAGDQSAATAVFDSSGIVHLVWLHKQDGGQALRYTTLTLEE